MGFTKLIEPIVKVQMGAFYSLINTHYFFWVIIPHSESIQVAIQSLLVAHQSTLSLILSLEYEQGIIQGFFKVAGRSLLSSRGLSAKRARSLAVSWA